MKRVGTVIIGAGAAGLFCAAQAGLRGEQVLLIDHADKVAEKIRISGGGRCNFTNREASPAQFHSRNPHFCRSALTRYTAQDFIALVQRYRIAFHEKHRGQLFCDESSQHIIDMLLREAEAGAVERWQPCQVNALHPRSVSGEGAPRWEIATARGPVEAHNLVIATGGLAIPKIGATDFGLRLARQLGHTIIEPRPALVPLVFETPMWAPLVTLAGVSLEVGIAADGPAGRAHFIEDLLFTHRGLSGPAVLQASSYWQAPQALEINFAPAINWNQTLLHAKQHSRRQIGNELSQHLPQRLAKTWLERSGLRSEHPLAELGDKPLRQLATSLASWHVYPHATEGWRKAEVMAGGIDTHEIDSRTMESRRLAGLYFIGEVVDVTGWLGGYNFQWAWSSAYVCAQALKRN